MTIFLSTFLPSVVFANPIEPDVEISPVIEEVQKPSITMAINDSIIVVNGLQTEITAPVLVLNRTYVDIYSLAPHLGYTVQWIEDYIGYFRVNAGGHTVDFTLISQWDDLINQQYKFFVRDSQIFVSLRELTDLLGYDIAYNKGIVTVGDQNNSYAGRFTYVYPTDFSDYVYKKYPCWAQYVINPYLEYSYETMMKNAQELQHMYPELIRTSTIGKSVEGRELLLIEFGRGPKRVFVCGTHHAREYISTTYLMYAIDRYAYAYRTNTMWGNYNANTILDNVTFCIVPMVNPDGVNLVQNGIYATSFADELSKMKIYEGASYGYAAWKANVRGVDVNWNYDKDWSINRNKNARGSTGFNGDYPNSEPETMAVANYVDNNAFEVYLSFHTQGQIFYWADNPDNPTNIHKAIKNSTGFDAYKEDGTGVGGSFFDYVYRKFKKPTITVELCPYVGNYPYPNTSFDTVWRPAKDILLVVGNEIIK